MFDDIRCELPMPDNGSGEGFQTKDLNCDGSDYVITADGRLVKLAEYGDDPARGMDTNYEGRLVFYGGYGGSGLGGMREFIAEFKDGRLTLLAFADILDE